MMLKQKIILIGGGGHCRSCIDVIELTEQFHIEGILDREDIIGDHILGYQIIGTDNDILKYSNEGFHFLITIGQIKSAAARKNIFKTLELNGVTLATVISPRAYVSKFAQIGKGTIVMHNALVNANANIGENCILNTGCNIEHDAVIGNHTHISTTAVINGGCTIGDEAFIGSNATIASQLKLADNIVIGAGATVIKDISSSGTYAGNPAKQINA